MYCDRCGAQLNDSQRFCHSCGKSFAVAAEPTQKNRVAAHVGVLGVLWIVYSIFHLIPAGALFTYGTVGLPWTPHLPDRLFMGPFFTAFGLLGVVSVIIGVAAGIGLVNRYRWSRILAIVLACLSLLNIPFGAALGIYTLWVLLPSSSEREFRQLAGGA